jgi:hypothetical protein
MKKLALVIGFLFWSGTAGAQNLCGGNFLVQNNLSELLCGGSAAQFAARTNLGVGGSPGPYLPLAGGTVTGATIFSGSASLNGGGTLSGTFTGNPIFSGAPTFTGSAPSGAGITALFGAPPALGGTTPNSAAFTTLSATGASTLSNQITQFLGGAGFNVQANNVGIPSAQYFYSNTFFKNLGGSATPLAANSFTFANSFNCDDQIYSNGTVFCLSIAHSITGATPGSGSRQAFTALLNFQPYISGAAWTGSGIQIGGGIGVFSARNIGGTSTLYAGAYTGFNPTAGLGSGATYATSVLVDEHDFAVGSGASYGFGNNLLLVTLGTHQVRGYVNDNTVIEIAAGAPALADMVTGIKFGDATVNNTMDAYARLIFVSPTVSGLLTTIASAQDYSRTVPKTAITRTPFQAEFTLNGAAITSARRLTTDGAAAGGFVYDAYTISIGTGWTANPTIALSAACDTAVLTGLANGAGNIGKIGVATRGGAVKAECAISSITGTGSGATGGLVVAGNTLNFAINSSIGADCTLTAFDGTDSVTWKSVFTATMGATASTTAINPQASFTGAISGTTLTASAVLYGNLGIGSVIAGSGVTGGTTITAFGTGSGGAGTYTVSASQSVSGEAMTGSPFWTPVGPTAGALTNIAISPPAADTALGAINITVTPSSGTWNVGGKCTVSSTSQVI